MKIHFLLICLIFASHAQAQSSKSKAAAAKAKAAAQAAAAAKATAKKKTIGELLKQADRGAGAQLGSKNAIQLPAFSKDLFSSQPAPRRSDEDLRKVKPPKTSSFLKDDGDDKVKLERITDQQIQELYKLTQKFKDSPNRGELWLRLAELYVEKAGLIDFRKQAIYDQKLKDYQAGKSKVKPLLDMRDAKEFNRKAIQLYEWFARDFPKDPKMDQALFFLGYNYYEIGDLKKGTFYYNRLTKEHPRSVFILESHFALAEYYFENEKWHDAVNNYAVVVKRPQHRLFSFSMYKTAWALYRLGRTSESLKTMESLIRHNRLQAQNAEGKKTVNQARLEGEGLRDIVLFYSDVGTADQAPGYFQNIAGAEANKYLEKLAYLYADKGNREGARHLFNYLIRLNPAADKAFDYKYQIVQAYSTANKTREFREELYSWIKDFGPGSVWTQAHTSNKDLLDNSYKLRETTLRTWILQQHQTAQNSHSPFAQNLSMEGYRLYLQEFNNSPLTADMHFYYAELLYDMGRFDEAGTQYRWIVDNAPTSKFYNKAAENVVLAFEKGLPKEAEITKLVGKSVDPVPLDPKTDKFVQASIWYVGKFPASPRAVEIKFYAARLLYQHNQFEQAIPHFKEIVQKFSKTKQAEYSANILLDIYNLKKDYAGLEKTAQELLAVPGISDSQAGKDIRGVLEKSSFKRAQELEVAKDYGKSAEMFEAFARQNPTSNLATSAMFNAAINFERAGRNSSAIAAHAVVIQSKDKAADPLKPKSRRILAKLYQDAGMLDEAAHAYRATAIEAGKDPLAANLFYNAGVIFEALGKNVEAIQNYEAYYTAEKKREKSEIFFTIAEIYRRQGSSARAIDNYKKYIDEGHSGSEKGIEAYNWIYRLSIELNRRKDTEDYKAKTLALQKRLAPNKKGPGAKFVAQIKFEEAVEFFDKFKRISIPADTKKQQKAAKEKIDMISQLNQLLAEVIKYDSAEEIVGALSILGQANMHMGDALVTAPLPPGLNSDEMKQYKAGIEKIAEPFFKQAKESLKASVDRASELDAYTKYSARAKELLVRIDPKLVQDGGEFASETKLGSWIGL